MYRFMLLASIVLLPLAQNQVLAAEASTPVGTWRSGYGLFQAFIIEFKADGTGRHFKHDLVTGKLSDPIAVRWSIDPTNPKAFALVDARLDRKGCRMHPEDNGNLSIRGNSEGEIWVVIPDNR